jgi:PAS domain-containing protein
VHSLVGGLAGVLTILPAAAVGWLLGLRAGLVFGLLSIPLNVLLYTWTRDPIAGQLAQHVLSGIAWSGVGAVFGWLSGLADQRKAQACQLARERETLRAEIAKREQAEMALRDTKNHLEVMVVERTAQLRESNEQLQVELAERQHAVEALRESEARYRQIVDSASDIIYRIGLDGRFTFVNPIAPRLMGLFRRGPDRQTLSRADSTRFPRKGATALLQPSEATRPQDFSRISRIN